MRFRRDEEGEIAHTNKIFSNFDRGIIPYTYTYTYVIAVATYAAN